MDRSLVPFLSQTYTISAFVTVACILTNYIANQRQLFHEKPQIRWHPMCRVTPFRMPVLKSLVLSSFSLQLSPSPTILQHTQHKEPPRYLVPGASSLPRAPPLPSPVSPSSLSNNSGRSRQYQYCLLTCDCNIMSQLFSISILPLTAYQLQFINTKPIVLREAGDQEGNPVTFSFFKTLRICRHYLVLIVKVLRLFCFIYWRKPALLKTSNNTTTGYENHKPTITQRTKHLQQQESPPAGNRKRHTDRGWASSKKATQLSE